MAKEEVKGKFKQTGSETSSVVWFRDGSTDQKTGGRAGVVEILFGSDEDGQD